MYSVSSIGFVCLILSIGHGLTESTCGLSPELREWFLSKVKIM